MFLNVVSIFYIYIYHKTIHGHFITKIAHDAVLGNHLVANKSIKEGEVILQESPLVMGPAQQTVPVCLGCYVPVDGSYKCPR